MNANHLLAPGTPVRSNSSGSNAPNPFTERAPSRNGGQAVSSGGSTPAVTRHDSLSSAHGDDEVAPPAYSDEDGTYANLQRDVKQPIVMTAEGTSSGGPAATSNAAAPAPAAPTPPPKAPVPAPAAPGQANGNKRPTSAFTVYDPSDAYGGM